MTLPAGILSRTDIGNIALEDVSDIVTNIAPTETVWTMHIGTSDATNDAHEWTQDDLPDAKADNKHVDGDDFVAEGGAASDQVGSGSTGTAISSGTRLGNHCQISRVDIVVSRRAQNVKKAGRRDSLGYQLAKGARVLKRDVEMSMTSRNNAVQGTESDAGQSAGGGMWIRTNRSAGASAGAPAALVNGFPTGTAPTDGTGRALSEATLLTQLAGVYGDGGDTNLITMSPEIKQRFSSYMFSDTSRIATQYQDQGSKPRAGGSVLAAVDYYTSDFGVIEIHPNRFQSTADVYILETDLWALAYLESYNVTPISRTGLSEKRILSVDWCLECLEEKGNAVITDIDDVAMVQ